MTKAKLLQRDAKIIRVAREGFDENGYWVGDGGGASGILPICSSTGRICLAWRSSEVATGDCWGTLGGAVKEGMSPSESAKAELAEEAGYGGSVEMHPAYVFRDRSFAYANFIGVVPNEFPFNPHGQCSWETDTIEWASWADIQEDVKKRPGDYHPGLLALFKQSRDLIEKLTGGSGPKGGKTAANHVPTDFDSWLRSEKGIETLVGSYSWDIEEQFGGSDRKASLQAATDDLKARFEELKRTFNSFGSRFPIYRMIAIEDLNTLRTESFGQCWTWDPASTQRRAGSENLHTFRTNVQASDVDWEIALYLNLNPYIGRKEAEIPVKKGTRLQITGWVSGPVAAYATWQKPMPKWRVVTASSERVVPSALAKQASEACNVNATEGFVRGQIYTSEEVAVLDVTLPDTVKVALVSDIEVFPDYLGKGYATKILHTFIDKAVTEGASLCILWPFPMGRLGHAELIAWYKRHGFIDSPRFPGMLEREIGPRRLGITANLHDASQPQLGAPKQLTFPKSKGFPTPLTRPKNTPPEIRQGALPSFEEFVKRAGGLRQLIDDYDAWHSYRDAVDTATTKSTEQVDRKILEFARRDLRQRYAFLVKDHELRKFPLDLYREARLPSGIESLRTVGVGVCWTWDENAAEAYWGEGGEGYILHTQVTEYAVDWFTTLHVNLDPTLGEEEKEVRLFEGAKLALVGWKRSDGGTKWETPPQRFVTASVTASADDEPKFEPWIGVDLDSTIAQNIPGNDYSDPTLIGLPVDEMVEKIKKLIEQGITVKVFTARMADKENAKKIADAIGDYTEKYIGTRLEATNEKDPGCIEIWDDKARRVEENTGKFASQKQAAPVFPSFSAFLKSVDDPDRLTSSHIMENAAWDLDRSDPNFTSYPQEKQDRLMEREVRKMLQGQYALVVSKFKQFSYPLPVYREVVLKDISDLRTNDVGVYWAWDIKSAADYAYDGSIDRGRHFVLKAMVPASDIDWFWTLRMNLDLETGDAEKEIRLKAGVPLSIVGYKQYDGYRKTQKEDGNWEPLHSPTPVTASQKESFVRNDLVWLKNYMTMSNRDKGEEVARNIPGYFKEFLTNSEPELAEQLYTEEDEDCLDDYSQVPDAVLAEFLDVGGSYLMRNDPTEAPFFLHSDFRGIIQNQWLIHFSDNADEIAEQGFRFGVDEMGRLGLTTNLSEAAKKYGGYNFAFLVSDVRRFMTGRRGFKYGKHCVVFRASGVQVYHYGDEEPQVIFWGKDAGQIVPITWDGSCWSLPEDGRGKPVYQNEDLETVAEWVETNYPQYRRALLSKAASVADDVHLTSECYDSHRDEQFCEIRALDPQGHMVGHLDYTVLRTEIWVRALEAPDATLSNRMLALMEQENPGRRITWADTTFPMGKKASPDFGYRRYHDDHEEQLKQIKWKFKNVSNMETLLTANLNKGQVGHLFLGRYGDQLTVREIGIDEVWRGTGLGQMLYDRAIQYGKEKGYKYFYSDFEGTRSDDAESAWKRLRQRYPVQTDEASQRYFIPLTQATKAASDKTPPGSERTEYPEDSNGWALFPDKREGTSMAPSLNKLIPENEKD